MVNHLPKHCQGATCLMWAYSKSIKPTKYKHYITVSSNIAQWTSYYLNYPHTVINTTIVSKCAN